jgi:hypothetical protein
MVAESDQQPKREKDEYIKLAYQSVLEDIRFFKRQQWKITNYTLVIFGAIIAVNRYEYMWEKVSSSTIFGFIIGAITVLSVFLISSLECSLRKVRNRKKEVRKVIPSEMDKLLFGDHSSRFSEIVDQYGVLVLLLIVIVGGGILSIYALHFIR